MSAVITKQQDETAWLAERRKGIGGSDIAALLGLSKWMSPYELWLDKTGRLEQTPDPDQAERMHFGEILEDIIAGEYKERKGAAVQRINQILVDPKFPVARANLDRVVVTPGSRARWNGSQVLGADKGLEIKAVNAYAANSPEWGEEGSDKVPVQYSLQCLWYAGVTGLPSFDLAALFGGQKFKVFTIHGDRELFESLAAEASDWWERYIKTDTPPPPSNANDAKLAFREHIAGKIAAASEEVANAVFSLQRVKSQIKGLEQQEKELMDTILPAFADAEQLDYLGKPLATWKANKPKEVIDWKSAYEDLSANPETHVFDDFVRTVPGSRVLRIK